MKTFNDLTPIEVSRINASVASDHNLKLISTVIHTAIQSCNKHTSCISLLTEKMFNLLDTYIMDNFGDFDDKFFESYTNNFHPKLPKDECEN